MEGVRWIAVILIVHYVTAEDQLHRYKRQLGMTGGDACLQIYSVPKEIVKCQPTDEVVEEFNKIYSLLDESTASTETLNTRVDGLDPDQPKDLPEEVKEKLKMIDEVQLALNDSIHTVKTIETKMMHLRAKVEELEADERREVTELIALQTDLIGTMLARANLSIHDAYIDRLNVNARELIEKLNKLEISLQERILDAQDKFSSEIDTLKSDVAAMKESMKRQEHIVPKLLKVRDCQEALTYYEPVSGVYPIYLSSMSSPFDVFCDMVENQGWTVLQRRQDGAVDFFRGWEEYRNGFGEVDGEHWIGLEKIHQFTKHKSYTIRVEVQDWQNKWRVAEYDNFRIESETNSYKIHVTGYHGDAGDSLAFHNGMPFSTMDRNNDLNNGICATWCHGAWWYKDCFHSNLNGKYYANGAYVTKTGWGDGMVWRGIQNSNFYSLKSAVMKIKPNE